MLSQRLICKTWILNELIKPRAGVAINLARGAF